MATTALFAEVLVVGLLALPWFGLVLAVALRTSLHALPDLRGWEGLGVAVGVAYAYALGIVVDRLGDWAFESWDERISQAVRRATPSQARGPYPERPEVRFRLMDKAPAPVIEFLDYARSRRRILRGLILNSFFTLTAAAVALIIGAITAAGSVAPLPFLVTLIAVSLAIGAGALFGWWHIGLMYYRRSLLAFQLFGSRSDEASPKQS